MLWLFFKYWQAREAPVYSQLAESRTSVAVRFVHSSVSWFPLHDPGAFLKNPCVGLCGVHPRGVCLHTKAVSPYLTSLCLTAFQGLNPDKACLDLSLQAHNQAAGETTLATWVEGVSGGQMGGKERRKRKWPLTGDLYIRPIVYLLSKQTGYTAGWYGRWKMDGREDMKQGEMGEGSERKHRIRESSTICYLEDLKNKKKLDLFLHPVYPNVFCLKAKTNIYLFITNYSQHSSK